VHVVDSSPANVFDRAALNAVKRWHYQPWTVNGTPQEIHVQQTLRFDPPP
jgi:protein TonB